MSCDGGVVGSCAALVELQSLCETADFGAVVVVVDGGTVVGVEPALGRANEVRRAGSAPGPNPAARLVGQSASTSPIHPSGSQPLHIVVIIAFALILGSLFSGLYFVMKDKGKSNRAVTALTFRVGFSILLFLFILFSYRMGWIHPSGLPLSSQ